MKRFLLTIMASVLSVAAFALNINGLVVDENNEALPFASVFLDKSPTIGTITDDNGKFTLEVDVTTHLQDSVVVSFLGYKAYKKSLYDISQGLKGRRSDTVLKFRMEPEQMYISDAKLVETKGKGKKKEMESLLGKIKRQMAVDFPMVNRSFKVKADTYVKNEEKVLGVEEDVGVITEKFKPKDNGKMKFWANFETSYHKHSLSPELSDYLAAIDSAGFDYEGPDTKQLNKQAKQGIESAQKQLQKGFNPDDPIIPQGVAGIWPDFFIYKFEEFADKPGEWTVNPVGDQLLLTCSTKAGFMGIVKIAAKAVLRVSAETYSVKSYSLQVHLAANIPFGYKLREEELELLNVLNATGVRMDAFKMKKVNADFTINAFFVQDGIGLRPSEKDFIGKGEILDRKGRGVKLNGAVKAIVLPD